MVVALGLLVGSSAYAAACGACGDGAKCQDPQAVQQFRNETTALANELQAKELALRSEFAFEGINLNRADALEGEIKEIRAKIRSVADRFGFSACCAAQG